MIDFIVNPASGRGAGQKCADECARAMESRGLEFSVHTTEKKGDAAAIARERVKNKSRGVAVIGGDGSVQEIAGEMADTGVPLGIVPAGSGNDLVASLYPGEKGTQNYIEKIINGKTRDIDIIKCSVPGFAEPLYSVNIGGVGLDAEIVHKADDFKKVFGHFAYIVSTVYNAFTYKPRRISVISDETESDGALSLVSACNGGVYGGGFRIAPDAAVDDGLITLCVIKPLSKIKILALFPSVLSGKHTSLNEVAFYKVKRADVGFDGTARLNLDGNIFDCGGPVAFEIMPGSLKIFS